MSTMKSHTQYFTFHTKKKRELVHLTPRLHEVLAKSGMSEVGSGTSGSS